MWFWILLIGALCYFFTVSGLLLALALRIVFVRAVERPQRGERTDYRLEQE